MKSRIITLLVASALSPLTAAENGGLFVDVQKTSLERNDRGYSGQTTIDRKMALKINIQNNSMKELAETTLNYVMVIQRWGFETPRYERAEGQLKLASLRPSLSTTVNAGEIHIQGHMHGTSDRHVDRIAGWKITIARDGKNLDFMSSSNFDNLNSKVKK